MYKKYGGKGAKTETKCPNATFLTSYIYIHLTSGVGTSRLHQPHDGFDLCSCHIMLILVKFYTS